MNRRTRAFTGLIAIAMLLGACSGNVFELAVGDCFDDGDLGLGEVEEIEDVPMVECEEPHYNEVYAVATVEGDVFPGEEAIQLEADEVCFDAFDGFVGLDYESSALDFAWLVPTAASWDSGDRLVACFIYRMDLGKVSGTLEGSGI